MHPEKYRKTNCVNYEEPPTGLRSRTVVAIERMSEIIEAVNRYSLSKLEIPLEWINEYNELAEFVSGEK